MLNKLFLGCLFILFSSVIDPGKGKTLISIKSDSNFIEEEFANNQIQGDSLIQEFHIKTFFDQDDKSLFIEFIKNRQPKRQYIGRYSNTFGDAPKVDLIQINDKTVGIVIVINFLQLGQSGYGMYFFTFDLNEEHLIKLCEFPDISIHDMLQDTLSDIQYFDYLIKTDTKEFLLMEYHPFKTSKSDTQYTIKTSECYFK